MDDFEPAGSLSDGYIYHARFYRSECHLAGMYIPGCRLLMLPLVTQSPKEYGLSFLHWTRCGRVSSVWMLVGCGCSDYYNKPSPRFELLSETSSPSFPTCAAEEVGGVVLLSTFSTGLLGECITSILCPTYSGRQRNADVLRIWNLHLPALGSTAVEY